MGPFSLYLQVVALGVIIFLLWKYFAQIGSSRAARDGDRPELAAIQAGLMGLLALLLGFTYSFAVGRYEERRRAVIAEANAISTSWNMVDFVDEPWRAELKSLLREYGQSRIVTAPISSDAELEEVVARAKVSHERIWHAAVSGMGNSTRPTNVVLSAQLNLMFDLHESRLAAARERLPAIVVAMLFFTAGAMMAISGFICGLYRRRDHLLAVMWSLLIAAVVFVILDLDHPGQGLIRVSQQPLINVVDGMKPPASQP